ncbi:Uncharacterized protein GBIM_11530 [Gryllus bimaculatus]|nr:Uncharacterized protein GBIM_11530 [Gryllus bimaculatus]
MFSRNMMPSTNCIVTNSIKKVKGKDFLSLRIVDLTQRPRLLASARARGDRLLTLDNLNPCIKAMEYAVRGPLVTRALEIEKELKQGTKNLFNEVIKANIGDSQAMGQTPITFVRQVMALVTYPELMKVSIFPDDVKERAKLLLTGCRGESAGAYPLSPGNEFVCRHVAEYIEKRDGFPCDSKNIILCAGATEGIKQILKLLICETEGLKPAIMVPVPQYPLYSSTTTEFGMQQVDYYLDESRGWALTTKELTRALNDAKGLCNPRALVVINPGNPTGQVLTKENIEEIINFAYEKGLILLADEVYQNNIYDKNSEFHSFKKVMMQMGPPYCEMELASFMSSSKGYTGECGFRGGYIEMINFEPEVKATFLKSIVAIHCSTLGQVAVDCVVKPPEPGQPSYELFVREKTAVLKSLAERAEMVANTFNSIEGMSCNAVQGAMYAFPQIYLPDKAIQIAGKQQISPDTYYALQLLENTGICIVPGSGFGQKEGTHHFRTTILPQHKKLKKMLQKFRTFHEEFLKQHK